jgi:hypothetical protein
MFDNYKIKQGSSQDLSIVGNQLYCNATFANLKYDEKSRGNPHKKFINRPAIKLKPHCVFRYLFQLR